MPDKQIFAVAAQATTARQTVSGLTVGLPALMALTVIGHFQGDGVTNYPSALPLILSDPPHQKVLNTPCWFHVRSEEINAGHMPYPKDASILFAPLEILGCAFS